MAAEEVKQCLKDQRFSQGYEDLIGLLLVLSRENIVKVLTGERDFGAVDFDKTLVVEVEGEVVVVALLSEVGEEVRVKLVLEDYHWINWL